MQCRLPLRNIAHWTEPQRLQGVHTQENRGSGQSLRGSNSTGCCSHDSKRQDPEDSSHWRNELLRRWSSGNNLRKGVDKKWPSPTVQRTPRRMRGSKMVTTAEVFASMAPSLLGASRSVD